MVMYSVNRLGGNRQDHNEAGGEATVPVEWNSPSLLKSRLLE